MARFYLTTAIDYPNSAPHLGTAYEKVTADVIARWQRMAGKQVWFLMGNDEHSVKVARKAAEQGLTPMQWCDRMEAAFKERWAALDVRFDDFIRTSEPRHHAGVKALVEAVQQHSPGDIVMKDYEGWYCTGCEAFKLEKDLEDGKCPEHPSLTPDWLKEKNHFFLLSRYRDRVQAHIEKDAEFIQPESRRNELLALLKEGLQDLSISRPKEKALGWGIPFPGDPDSVVYVWFDALANYITAVGYGQDPARFAHWWPADLHVVGKDITRFHCVIWPAMLMAAGVPLPKRVFGHGWISFQGERLSKTLGNLLEPLDVVAKLGADALRLYLIREVPYGSDGDFTWERFETRFNADLANNYGNLLGRITAMAASYRDGKLADPGGESALKPAAAEAVASCTAAMEAFALHEGMNAAFKLLFAINDHISTTEPFKMAKDPAKREELDRVLFDVAEATRIATLLLTPVIPRAAASAMARLGVAGEPTLAQAAWGAAGALTLTKGDALFPRLEDPAKAKKKGG